MSNPSGKKGAAFERLIADCLAATFAEITKGEDE